MEIEEMRRIAAKRTAGEWKLEHGGYFIDSAGDEMGWIVCAEGTLDDGYSAAFSAEEIYGPNVLKNNEFIALAAGVFDKLLDVAEAAKNIVDNAINEERLNVFDLARKIGALEAE